MTRTTPPRPLDVEALFPELAAHRGTTTRLHPSPGSPGVTDSSLGGPLLWPADEPWPVCTEPHPRARGRRPEDIRRHREVLAAAWRRDPGSGPTEEDRRLLDELRREHRVPDLADSDPLPMIGLAQLHRRDLPDLPPGPPGCDLLQVFWCPFDRHGRTGYGMSLDVRWRDASQVTDPLDEPPRPPVVGYEGYVPEPCVLHPEQVRTYPFAGLLPEKLRERIDAWEDRLEEEREDEGNDGDDRDGERERGGTEWVDYQYDLSIPPGWRVGGYASWHTTDPSPVLCLSCSTPVELLLTIDSSEWDGGSGSWRPVEQDGLRPHPHALPTQVIVGRAGELNLFSCPSDPTHPHRWSIQ